VRWFSIVQIVYALDISRGSLRPTATCYNNLKLTGLIYWKLALFGYRGSPAIKRYPGVM
jgi:hypothetical protein